MDDTVSERLKVGSLKRASQFHLRFDLATFDRIETCARKNRMTAYDCGKSLLLERLTLEAAGWKIEDDQLATLLETIVRLPAEAREKVYAITSNTPRPPERSNTPPDMQLRQCVKDALGHVGLAMDSYEAAGESDLLDNLQNAKNKLDRALELLAKMK